MIFAGIEIEIIFILLIITLIILYILYKRKLKEYTKLISQSEHLIKQNHNKDHLFSIIAHDLKSPFTALLGSSEILLDESDNMSKEEIKKFASNIHESSKKVHRLLENLLEWSRLQTGKIEFHPEVFHVHDLIQEVVYLYQQNAESKKIKILTSIDPKIKINADINMLDAVFRNLISNAIKFTYPGGKIIIEGKETDGIAEFSITDTGMGISGSDIPKLFTLDNHLTKNGTAKEKGTGLGLILCKEFIEKNGGEIKVESELGKGSSFIFYLPAVQLQKKTLN